MVNSLMNEKTCLRLNNAKKKTTTEINKMEKLALNS